MIGGLRVGHCSRRALNIPSLNFLKIRIEKSGWDACGPRHASSGWGAARLRLANNCHGISGHSNRAILQSKPIYSADHALLRKHDAFRDCGADYLLRLRRDEPTAVSQGRSLPKHGLSECNSGGPSGGIFSARAPKAVP
jgi:hypothetical protein